MQPAGDSPGRGIYSHAHIWRMAHVRNQMSSHSSSKVNDRAEADNMVLHKPENKHVLKAFDLSGKVAAVTGGARGIGLEVSRGLAEAGANVRRNASCR